jgi:hypothetical protein
MRSAGPSCSVRFGQLPARYRIHRPLRRPRSGRSGRQPGAARHILGAHHPARECSPASLPASPTAADSASRAQITGKTSFNASGTYSLTRFLNSSTAPRRQFQGLNTDSDSVSAGAQPSHRCAQFLWRQLRLLAQHVIPAYQLRHPSPGFSSQSASLQYSHQFTRQFGISASAGPQWNDSGTPGSTQSPQPLRQPLGQLLRRVLPCHDVLIRAAATAALA